MAHDDSLNEVADCVRGRRKVFRPLVESVQLTELDVSVWKKLLYYRKSRSVPLLKRRTKAFSLEFGEQSLGILLAGFGRSHFARAATRQAVRLQ